MGQNAVTIPDLQFEKLLSRSKAGDQECLLELVLQHQKILSAFVSKQIGTKLINVVGEEDILQETFVQALRSIADFKGTRKVAFVAWLKAIATNRIRDVARKTASAKRGGGMNQVVNAQNAAETKALNLIEQLTGDGYTPSVFAARREAVSAIQAALVVLPEDQRQAVEHHCFEKLTLDQTAKKMGRSRDSVRGLIQRAKQSLRISMEASSKWFSNH